MSVRTPGVLVLCLLMVNMSVAAYAGPAKPALDGETIFRGLFFGTGPAAKLLPEVWQNADVLRQMRGIKTGDAAAAHNRIVDNIRRNDAEFFQRFGVEMQSGDHFRVDAALTDATRAITRAISEEFGVDMERGLPEESEAVGAWVVVTVAVAIFAVAAYIVAAYKVMSLDMSRTGDPHAASLERELMVEKLVNRLQHAQ